MRNAAAPIPAIVAPAVNNEQAKREIRKLNIALQDAERAHDSASQDRLRRLLVFGHRLIEERAKDPAKRSRVFAELLRDCGIDKNRASEAMKYAGYVEELGTDSVPNELPDLREAGIDKKPRKAEADSNEEPGESKSEADEVYDVTGRIMRKAQSWDDDKRRLLVHELKNLIEALEAM